MATKRKKQKSAGNIILDILTYTLLIIIALIVILPVVWIVLSSFQVGTTLYSSTFIPDRLTFEHYVNLFTKTDYPIWYKNTLNFNSVSN